MICLNDLSTNCKIVTTKQKLAEELITTFCKNNQDYYVICLLIMHHILVDIFQMVENTPCTGFRQSMTVIKCSSR